MALKERSGVREDHAEILARQGFACGGDGGIRTRDPLLAKQVLSQLSYTPIAVAAIDFRAFAVVRKLGNTTFPLSSCAVD